MTDLQIERNDDDDGEADGQLDPNDAEIIQMNQDLTLVQRDYQQLQERFKKVNIVNDQISNWSKRCFMKLGTLTEDRAFQQEPVDLITMFDAMNNVVSGELGALKKREEEEGADEGIDYGEVFTDFATPEFLDKNIRVRPISGVTHGDDTRDGR
mmetsp:Transcript_24059/g.28149  ORF Transcript_24059/g.28149 Transcript_24059/m.28149 type:complete len:154 (+) Transcript_24059:1035-1496(+)